MRLLFIVELVSGIGALLVTAQAFLDMAWGQGASNHKMKQQSAAAARRRFIIAGILWATAIITYLVITSVAGSLAQAVEKERATQQDESSRPATDGAILALAGSGGRVSPLASAAPNFGGCAERILSQCRAGRGSLRQDVRRRGLVLRG
jgi:hypothetical protein